MHITGIIAEYNPFHTGHLYHLETARNLSDADFVIAVMSPDFVQRGEPAVFDKYTRTRMALHCGADLVLELPVCYAAGSAEYFAQGAVSLLHRLGCVDTLCFGSETADPSLFASISGLFAEEPEDYRKFLQAELKKGVSFPKARAAAAASCCPDPAVQSFLSRPNNILGIEYCKALLKLSSSIRPLPVLRSQSDFHDETLTFGSFCSASALRKALQPLSSDPASLDPASLLSFIPEQIREEFQAAASLRMESDDFLSLLTDRLFSFEDFSSFQDFSGDLSGRLLRLRNQCPGLTYEEIIRLLHSRQLTDARLRRCLLHLLLSLPESSLHSFRQNGTVFYARILGFRTQSAPLLHHLKQTASVPLLTKLSSARKLLSPVGLQMLSQDIAASHLYCRQRSVKYHLPFRSEYENSPVRI